MPDTSMRHLHDRQYVKRWNAFPEQTACLRVPEHLGCFSVKLGSMRLSWAFHWARHSMQLLHRDCACACASDVGEAVEMAHDKHTGSIACTSAVCPVLLACPQDVSVLSVALAQACASVHGTTGLEQGPGTRSTAFAHHTR